MRLFHVSEESDIRVFEPRLPTRTDLDPNIGLVWAIDERRLPNFLTPRDCPRVAYHVSSSTSDADRARFFSSPETLHAVVIEGKWHRKMCETALYIYEFDPDGFTLLDDVAGYYVATSTQIPIGKQVFTDLIGELVERGVELRLVDNLWPLADEVTKSTLSWSLCRMAFASPRR